MKTQKHTVLEGGERLDQYLGRVVEGHSRSYLKRLIDENLVTVGGKPAKASRKVAAGEEVVITLPDPVASQAAPEEIPLEIIHEDRWLLAVAKPAGLVVHPAPGHPGGTLVNALLHHISDLSGIGGVLRPGIVHRLDKDTSGVLLIAKDDQTHRSLQRLFKERRLEKTYLALVVGKMSGEGVIDTNIGRHRTNRKKFAAVREGGRTALTRWKALEALSGATLLEVRIETGRTHQIRVHLASVGHPVVNDPLYGGAVLAGRGKAAAARLKGQALHAACLVLDHPATGERLNLTAAPPEDFQALAQALRGTGQESQGIPVQRRTLPP